MADLPHISPGDTASASRENDRIAKINTHSTQIEGVQTDISNLDTRVTSAENDISQNDTELSNIQSRLDPLEADTHPIRTQATDTDLYGDIVNSHRRGDCYHSEVLANNVMTAFASISSKTFTANELRLCVTTAGVTPGTFDIGFYVGTGLDSLVQQYSAFGSDLVDTTGMLIIPFDSGVQITEGDYIAVEMIATNWGTSPEFSSTPVGPNAQFLIGAEPYSVFEEGRSYPPDDPIDLTGTAWTLSNQSFWFALA